MSTHGGLEAGYTQISGGDDDAKPTADTPAAVPEAAQIISLRKSQHRAAELTSAQADGVDEVGSLRPKTHRRLSLIWLPVLLAAIATVSVNAVSIGYRLTRPYPLNPYEAAYVLDGYRAAHGIPVYENIGQGHATVAYGPLEPYLLGAIFRWTGPNVYAGRALSLLAALILVGILVYAFAEFRTFWYGFIGAAIALSMHHRCRAYFTETRPDLTALMLATASLVAAYVAHRRGKFGFYALAIGFAVLAFLFKQTYAAAVMVPPLAILIDRPSRMRRQMAVSLLPAIAVAGCIIVLKAGFPLVWFYAFNAQAKFAISPPRALEALNDLFLYSPLYIALTFAVMMQPAFIPKRNQKISWLLAATVIGSLAAILAFAKRGGSYNSLLLGFAPMAGFCILALPSVINMLAEPRREVITRWGGSILLGLLFLATTQSTPFSNEFIFGETYNNASYPHVIKLARKLQGQVLSPDDPTITFFARGQLDHSMDCDVGAYGMPAETPRPVVHYLRSANWIIRVSNNCGPKAEAWMKLIGFEQAKHPVMPHGYSLWRRTRSIGDLTPDDAIDFGDATPQHS